MEFVLAVKKVHVCICFVKNNRLLTSNYFSQQGNINSKPMSKMNSWAFICTDTNDDHNIGLMEAHENVDKNSNG